MRIEPLQVWELNDERRVTVMISEVRGYLVVDDGVDLSDSISAESLEYDGWTFIGDANEVFGLGNDD